MRLGESAIHTCARRWNAGIADILEAHGELAQAQRLREEQVPVLKAARDIRAAALAQLKIADGLRIRGRFAEAMPILVDEVVPAYERLQDNLFEGRRPRRRGGHALHCGPAGRGAPHPQGGTAADLRAACRKAASGASTHSDRGCSAGARTRSTRHFAR